MPTVTELKMYLRIDGSEDDGILALLMGAGEEYLADAGVPDTAKTTKRYTLAIMLYVALHYENRDPGVSIGKLNFAFESLILQLKS